MGIASTEFRFFFSLSMSKVNLPPEVLMESSVQTDVYDNRYPWKNGHTSPDSSIFFNIVRLNQVSAVHCIECIMNTIACLTACLSCQHRRTPFAFVSNTYPIQEIPMPSQRLT